MVDDEDYPLLSRHLYHLNHDGYVMSSSFKKMVQELIVHKRPQFNILIIDGNHLNLTKQNLKEVHRGVPTHHVGKSQKKKYSSKYKGVCYNDRDKRFIAQVTKGDVKYTKYFLVEEDAAQFYNEKARE